MIDPTMAWRLGSQDEKQRRDVEYRLGDLVARVRRARWRRR
jgi:hypothetical protein